MPAQWSRLVRFLAVEDGRVHWGEPVDSGSDVGLLYDAGRAISVRPLASDDPLVGDGSLSDGPLLTVARLLAPVPQATMGTTMVRVLSSRKQNARPASGAGCARCSRRRARAETLSEG